MTLEAWDESGMMMEMETKAQSMAWLIAYWGVLGGWDWLVERLVSGSSPVRGGWGWDGSRRRP